MKLIYAAVLAMMLFGTVHAQITVTKALNGKDASITITAGGASTGASAGGDSANGSNMAAKPSEQPMKANPPARTSRNAAPNAAWQQAATQLSFNPLSNLRVLSPLCGQNLEATSCAAFSGNTAVVVSSVMPAIGTSTNVKTTQCFCDFRNTVNAFLPANQLEVYRCAAYCQ